MENKMSVTTGQLFLMLFVGRISTALMYTSMPDNNSGVWDLLLPEIISLLLTAVMFIPAITLFQRNRSRSVCRKAYDLSGHKAGSIITVLYAVYYLFAVMYVLLQSVRFLTETLSDGIEAGIIAAFLTLACIYAAVKGIEAAVRMSVVVLIMIVVSAVLLSVFLFPGYSSDNLVPSDIVTSDHVVGSVILLISRMNNAAALNMLLHRSEGEIVGKGAAVCVFTAIFFTFMITLVTGSVGEYLGTRQLMFYRAIDGSGTLQRLNPFFLLVVGCCVFCNITMLLSAYSECVNQLKGERMSKKYIIYTAVPLIVFIVFFTGGRMKDILTDRYVWFGLTVLFTTVIPLFLLVSEYIKKRTNKHKIKTAALYSATAAMIICMTFMSGCSATQLNQRIIVQGIGIDRKEDKCRLTVIALDTENGEQEKNVRLMYADGKDTEDAFRQLENRSGRKLLLSQCLFVMMNEEAAGRCRDTISYFENCNEVQKTMNLCVTGVTAEKTINTAIVSYKYRCESINTITDSGEVEQNTVHCSLLDIISAKNRHEFSIQLPYIAISDELKGLTVKGSYIAGEGSGTVLNYEETIDSMIINGTVQDISYGAVYGSDQYDDRIRRAETRIIPQIDSGGRLITRLFINVCADVTDDDMHRKSLVRALKNHISELYRKTVKDRGEDIFSLYKSVRNCYPDIYNECKDYKELLMKSEAVIVVNVTWGEDKGYQ